jgi:hypothetical protein
MKEVLRYENAGNQGNSSQDGYENWKDEQDRAY